MADPEDDVPLPADGLKEPAPLDDDEENVELPAETDPATAIPLDDLMNDDTLVEDLDDVDEDTAEEADDDAP